MAEYYASCLKAREIVLRSQKEALQAYYHYAPMSVWEQFIFSPLDLTEIELSLWPNIQQQKEEIASAYEEVAQLCRSILQDWADCKEIHVSRNNGERDAHLPLLFDQNEWWWPLLPYRNPKSVIFAEEYHFGKNR